jgi:HAD superfamily hydrolase (TIGR01549 family)
MKKYQAYIFDMDLTLLDTTKSAFLAYKGAFEAIGYHDLTNDDIPHHLSIPLKDSYLEIKNPTNDYQTFKDTFQKISLENIFTSSTIYPDALRLINALKKENKILGIVTNRDLYTVENILKNNHLENYFTSIITCEKVTQLKPSKEPIIKCLEELNIPNDQACYIGDAKNDYLASVNAQVDFICVERYHNCNFECPLVIHSMDEITL